MRRGHNRRQSNGAPIKRCNVLRRAVSRLYFGSGFIEYRAMKLVITRHRPVRNTLISIVLLGSVVLALGIAMDYGHWKSIARAMVSTGEKRSLLEEVVALRRENETLHFEVAQMRRAAEVNRHAGKDNHQQLVRLQSDAAALKSEVDFYRDVVGTTEVDTGPRVKGLKIKTLEGDGRYRYKLVITHVNKDEAN